MTSTLATFNVPAHHPFRFIITKGSIIDFSYPSNPQRAAIVNSSDEAGLGGGRVNGAVSNAGGPKLKVDRQNLPAKYSKRLMKDVRCPEGKAVMTGPNSYGKLKVPFVIHAFGGFGTQSLSSTYSSCLQHGKKANLEAIAFTLLMAGFYIGSEIMVYEVLKVGVNVIRGFEGYSDLKAVYMFAYSEKEAKMLLKVANEVFATSMSVIIPTRSVSTPPTTKKSGILGRLAMFSQRKQKWVLDNDDANFNEEDTQQVVPNEQDAPTKMNSDDISDMLELTSIDITNKRSIDNDIAKVAEVLERSNIIESIHVNENRLTMLDARFSRALAHSHTLKVLVMYNDQIDAGGAGILADALILNETIEQIDLGRNCIRDNGAIKLAGALQVNHTVQSIDLHHNQIGNAGAERLADALLVNDCLQSMNLQRNQIDDDGACFLADALERNSVVQTLELAFNPIGETLKQKFNDILIGTRPLSKETPTNRKSSLFFEKLLEIEDSDVKIISAERSSSRMAHLKYKLEILSRCITDVHMMKFYYTAVTMFQRSGLLTQEAASHYIQRGLCRTSETCSCSKSISCFKLILEKSESDCYIQRFDFHRFDNRAEVNRMESASFIVDLRESVKSNTARIDGLEANVEAINTSLNSIKEGLKHQMKIEATVGFLSAALNAISFGVGGSILDATINALGSIVDYSDLVHIQQVATQYGAGCVEQVENGIELAANEYADMLLSEAVEKGSTLTVISATAAMINARHPIHVNDTSIMSHLNQSVPTSETTSLPEQDDQKYLTGEKSYEEVERWLLTHLPRLQKEDVLRYCGCLIEDGFDSTDMLCDVREEDLHFMKKAHKRNLIQRMTGGENVDA